MVLHRAAVHLFRQSCPYPHHILDPRCVRWWKVGSPHAPAGGSGDKPPCSHRFASEAAVESIHGGHQEARGFRIAAGKQVSDRQLGRHVDRSHFPCDSRCLFQLGLRVSPSTACAGHRTREVCPRADHLKAIEKERSVLGTPSRDTDR